MVINGEKIAELRVSKGLSQEELGHMVGVSNVAIHYVETGKKPVQVSVLASIANVFGVTVDSLLKQSA